MSPNVGNFVHDLVEMAKAMETLPQVQAQLEASLKTSDELAETVQLRELAIIDYKAKIEELQAKVRATEAERDDAELRFLDLEKKSDKVLVTIRDTQAWLADAVNRLDPPKPQPEPEPAQPPIPEAVQSIEAQPRGQGEVSPIAGETTAATPQASVDQLQGASTQSSASQVQSEADPTTVQAPVENSSTSAYSPDVSGNIQTAAQESPKPPGPYTGKRYHDHPIYVSLCDWLAGGGTEENYRWHPNWEHGIA